MQEWEYRTSKLSPAQTDEPAIAMELARHGNEGWELAASIMLSPDETMLIFKRLKPVISESHT